MSNEQKRARVMFVAPEANGTAGRVSVVEKLALPDLSPVARNTLQEQAYVRLRQALMSGQFVPGQSITLRAAAAALGTSAMPVRDALRRLEIEHALVPQGNRTLGVPEMTCASLTELRDVRIALEGLAAEKAALLITPAEITVLEDANRVIVAAASAGDFDEYMRANWSFHSAIYQASRSQLLVAVIEPFWMRIGPYIRFMFPDRTSLIESLGNHSAALEALRTRDGAGARWAIQRDISESAEGLALMLRAQEAPAVGAGQVAKMGRGGPSKPGAKLRMGRR
jgi:DNA-binding GntR family transcriptional regulator